MFFPIFWTAYIPVAIIIFSGRPVADTILASTARGRMASRFDLEAGVISRPCGRFPPGFARPSFEAAPVGCGSGPRCLWKAVLNELVSAKPSSTPIWVTDKSDCPRRSLALSIRRDVRYRYGGSPNDSLKAREK